MTITSYTDYGGSMKMMNDDTCLEVLRRLGRTFAEGLKVIDKPAPEDTSDLWDGLAAYHMLDLKGENARLDAAHARVLRMVTDAAFDMAREGVR